MKLVLAVMCRDEAPLLRLHLPVWMQCAFDGFVVLDGGSTDESVALLQQAGAVVYRQQSHFPPVNWENELVERVEALETYTHIFRLDPDELIDPASVDAVRHALTHAADAVRLSRYNFMGDRLHYANAAPFYPDPQLKAWKLGCGVRYQQAIDSVPDAAAKGLRVRYCAELHLYHYSFVKPMPEYLAKRVPLERQARGESYADYVPEANAPYPVTPVPFTGTQPLDPLEVGIHAPYARSGMVSA